jgi:hypothetical protein
MKKLIVVFFAIAALPIGVSAQMSGGAQTGSYLGIGAGSYAFQGIANPTISQRGLNLICSAAGSLYQWYLNGILQSQFNGKQPIITIPASDTGVWTVSVANASGCTTTSPGLRVGSSGVEESPAATSLLTLLPASPDPANQSTTLSYDLTEEEDVVIVLWDVLGHEIEHETIGSQGIGLHEFIVPTTTLSSGVYTYMIEAGPVSVRQSFIVSK